MEVPLARTLKPSFQQDMMSSPIPQVKSLSELSRFLRTGSPDVEESTIIRGWTPTVGDIGGTDSDRRRGTGRGEASGVGIIVRGGNDGSNTRGDKVGSGFVNGSRSGTHKAHGSNRGATAAFSSSSDPVHSRDAVGNVSTDSNATPSRERQTHISTQAPFLCNVRVRRTGLGDTGEVHTRCRQTP